MSHSYIPAELRREVRRRARLRCEFCLVTEDLALTQHEVDHVVARKHGGLSAFDNLALACSLCNKRKGSDLTSIDPENGAVTPLFHPRRDRWSDHFRFEGAVIVPLSAIGRVTVATLRLNDARLLEARKLLLSAGVHLAPNEGDRLE